ncbi:MAG: hypothetical protein K0S68_893 [Candidatus Saccharibacteria bacterium]|jgi:hypothetical protein|nr:hypothetical protein [Candidatus Saccharibacteria bacterium]
MPKLVHDSALQQFTLDAPLGKADIAYVGDIEVMVTYAVEFDDEELKIKVGLIPGRGGSVLWVRMATDTRYCNWALPSRTPGWVERAHSGAQQAIIGLLTDALPVSVVHRTFLKIWQRGYRKARTQAARFAA